MPIIQRVKSDSVLVAGNVDTQESTDFASSVTGIVPKRFVSRSVGPVRAPRPPLPTELSEPISSLEEALFLIYGEKKIGKTSLASQFNDALFFMFEPGAGGLRILESEMACWEDFQEDIDQLIRTDKYRTIVIDTFDEAYNKCLQYVCDKEAVDHPSDGKYGNIWHLVKKEFSSQIDRIMKSKRGVVMLSHVQAKEYQSRLGTTYTKIQSTMSGQARGLATAVADVIGYYGYYGKHEDGSPQRYLTIAGSDNLDDTGTRLKYQFWVKGQYKTLKDHNGVIYHEGTRVHSVPMGKSEVEAYKNLQKAFNNEQETDGDPERPARLEKQAMLAKGR